MTGPGELARLEEFAAKYYPADAGKYVPLGMLMAWLFEHHEHGEDGVGMVPSMGLQRFAVKIAVSGI